MPRKTFMASLSSPKVDVVIDTGSPLFNLTVDGFLKIGTGVSQKITLSTRHCMLLRLKKMCKEGAYWGTVAGVYVGMEYGMERVRGTRDWKNAMLAGALTGAVVSAASSSKGDKIIMDAITGGAVATAAEFLNYLT